MSVTLDSSITIAWLYADETTQPVRHVFDIVVGAGAWVPTIWRLEVANTLDHGVRRGRHDRKLRHDSLADLALLNIAIDPDTNAFAWTTTLKLAEQFHLTLYDAAYVDLARRRNLPLATLDNDMRTAAKSLGIPLFGV